MYQVLFEPKKQSTCRNQRVQKYKLAPHEREIWAMYNCKGFQFFSWFSPVLHVWDVLTSWPERITRRSKNKLNQPFRKTNIGQNCLSYLGPKIWNNLPSNLKSATNINSFKHKIKDKFFNDLQRLDDSPYVYYWQPKISLRKGFSQHFSIFFFDTSFTFPEQISFR